MPSLAGQSPQTSAPPSSPHPDSPVDDFDDLIHQASLHGIRVLVTLSASNPTNDLSGLARLWLSHGVAGLNITTSPNSSPQTTQAIVQSMRRIAAAAVGQRIVLSALDPSTLPATPTAASPRRSVPIRNDRSLTAAGPQLQIDSRLGQVDPPDAATLRTVLTQAASQPNVLLDVRPASSTASPDPHPALVDAMAAIAMTNRPTALIDADDRLALEPDPAPAPPTPPPAPAPPPPQPPSGTYVPFVPLKKPAPAPAPHVARPSPLAAWYTQLALLHHSNATLRYGATTVLNFDAQDALVWVARPAVNSPLTPAVVVACNLSPNPVQLSLTSAMKTLDLHGFFLRTLARSDNGMGAQNLDSVTLPPFAVYIGELRR
jgi:hypothetical protein